ncbi:tRNA/rRNA methyltransferase (SpoU) [Thermodesulfobium narugense DSM 14796]|uniref:tRNA/rRNA methyltransferase (SpoU) n=1 Tax=Thermodesulfobium narugense DSM 14796 TaxID=747365 RepID=M1E606_9BACT|nr:RNA methyltransferase [Thermodesulfobium narugense]AEE13933.1 tRNA/rRNA methyltransferase (SpoU) [Thermodesulfobium narugense DSM 14796]
MNVDFASKSKIKELLRMKKSGQFIFFEGVHALEEALLANYIPDYVLIKDVDILEKKFFKVKIFEIFLERLKFLVVKEDAIKRLSSESTPTGIISVGNLPKEKDFGPFPWVYLDKIQDPGNLGTILRSSLAFGCGGIFLSEDSCNIYNPKVIRSSAGAFFKVPFRKRNFSDIVRDMDTSLRVFSFSPRAKEPFFLHNYDGRCLLVFGNEGRGISSEIESKSYKRVYIPTQNVESLNVAMCVNIVLSFLYFKKFN